MRTVEINDGGNQPRKVELIRRGRNNSRIAELDTGKDKLVVDSIILWPSLQDELNPAQGRRDRIVPLTPLHHFYRDLRKSNLTPESIEFSLGGAAGIEPGEFLAELFHRSVDRFSAYRNLDDEFIPSNAARTNAVSELFARRVVQAFRNEPQTVADSLRASYVDYEVSPMRTRRAAFEDGQSAKSSGHGGIDLLLRNKENGRPIVGEIKASTESVGITFALIQASKYAVELATDNQWERLCKYYDKYNDKKFNDGTHPGIEILIVSEVGSQLAESDITIAQQLSEDLLDDNEVAKRLKRVTLCSGEFVDKKLKLCTMFTVKGPI